MRRSHEEEEKTGSKGKGEQERGGEESRGSAGAPIAKPMGQLKRLRMPWGNAQETVFEIGTQRSETTGRLLRALRRRLRNTRSWGNEGR